MRWGVTCIAVLALALSTSAFAATPRSGTFSGEVERGSDVSFRVDHRGTRVRAIVARAIETCDATSTTRTTRIRPGRTWHVNGHGRFSGRRKRHEGRTVIYTTLTGHFTSRNRVSGTILQKRVAGGVVCSTSKLRYVATRG